MPAVRCSGQCGGLSTATMTVLSLPLREAQAHLIPFLTLLSKAIA